MIHRTSLGWMSAAGTAVIALTCAILATRDVAQGLGTTRLAVGFWFAFAFWAAAAVLLHREYRKIRKASQ